MVVGGEQEDGRYLGLQTSSVVNSKIFGKMVRNLALKEKQGDASDLDKLAEVVMALADRVLKQEREIQELKQEVKDKEVSCKNAEKLLHQRVSGFDDMLHEHEKKLVALEQVVSASPSEHDGESERASVRGSAQQRISELEMKLVGQTKRIETVEETISAQFGTFDGEEGRMQPGLGVGDVSFSEANKWDKGFGGESVIFGKECRVHM